MELGMPFFVPVTFSADRKTETPPLSAENPERRRLRLANQECKIIEKKCYENDPFVTGCCIDSDRKHRGDRLSLCATAHASRLAAAAADSGPWQVERA